MEIAFFKFSEQDFSTLKLLNNQNQNMWVMIERKCLNEMFSERVYKYTESCCLLVSPHRMRTITESKIFFEKTDKLSVLLNCTLMGQMLVEATRFQWLFDVTSGGLTFWDFKRISDWKKPKKSEVISRYFEKMSIYLFVLKITWGMLFQKLKENQRMERD